MSGWQSISQVRSQCSKFLLLLLAILLLTGCKKTLDSAAQILINLQQTYVYILDLIMAVAYLSGALFIVKSIFSFKVYGEQRTMMSSQVTIRTPLSYFVVGICLLFLPRVVSIMSNSVFMVSHLEISYQNAGDSEESIKQSVYSLIQIVGLIAIVKALFMASAPPGSSHSGGIAKAATHFVGGLAALNIDYMVKLIQNIT